MSILISKRSAVLIQGITGREGSRAAKEMLDYGTRVLAGVTPGKGGQIVEGVPVYDTVREALIKHPEINASLVVVPAAFVKDAVLESLSADIGLINVLTEHVPVADVAAMIAWARNKKAILVGPSSVGIISPGKGKIGSIGSGNVEGVYAKGEFGVISKSGGMTSEISSILTRAGLGETTAVGIGGDQLVGADIKDMLDLFQKDKETKAVVIFGEVGGSYEETAADFIKSGGFTKPVVAVIAGRFSKSLPKDTVLGHAGAIVSAGRGSYDSKVRAMRGAGVLVAKTLDELPGLARQALRKANSKKTNKKRK